MSEIAISLKNVSKYYKRYARPVDRLKEILLPGKSHAQKFWALQDINIEVARGETLGIIGRNGSGKSTLLQIIAGTLTPTQGEVRVNGRISALLELGSGFNPEFTGRQNVFLNGQILGLNQKEIEAKFDLITAFADIGEFIDEPVKTYSSGMFVRLAFAVAANCDSDILIVDEALAVGDIFFQQKCFEHIRFLQKCGVTILYVSHDLSTTQSICDRLVLMKDGIAIFDGDPNEAVNRYYSLLGQRVAVNNNYKVVNQTKKILGTTIDFQKIINHTILRSDHWQRHGGLGLELVAARVCDDEDRDTLVVDMMSALHFQLLLQAKEVINVPNLGIHLYNRMGTLVFATGTTQLRQQLPLLDTQEYLTVCLRLEMRIEPGEYTFNLVVGEEIASDNPNVGFVHDCYESLGPIMVVPPSDPLLPFYGIAQLPVTAEYEFKGKLDLMMNI